MGDIKCKISNQVKEFNEGSTIVTQWGEKGDESNLIQQTKNCLFCCEVCIKCNKLETKSVTQNFIDVVDQSEAFQNCIKPEFICTMDSHVHAKNMKNKALMSQKFCMFHRTDKKEIYVVFVSQETSAYILVDSDVWTSPKQKDIGRVDNIPISLFKALILQGYNIVFTGHSLGGALAILVTYKLMNKDLERTEVNQIRCITFGAPQVPYYVSEYMKKLKKIVYRYELPKDPVPQLLTAFQNDKIAEHSGSSDKQEFMVNLMNLLGLKHSFQYTADMELAQNAYINVNADVIKAIKKYSESGTTLVPKTAQQGWFLSKQRISIKYSNDWSLLVEQNQNNGKIELSSFLQQLREQHAFERYRREILELRIERLGLPNLSNEIKNADMRSCHIPEPKHWIQGPESYEVHLNQIQASFDDRYTKVVISSTLPYVFGIRYAVVNNFDDWGTESTKVIQDRKENREETSKDKDVFKVQVVFYSARDYEELKNMDQPLSLTLYGCFETVQNIIVKAQENSISESDEIRNFAYKDMNVQQLYISAFQTCLFAGEGHNPMLQGDTLPKDKREALLEEDHKSLVEMLGSLIVNQQLFKIITTETQHTFQQFLQKHTNLQHCNTGQNKAILALQKNNQSSSIVQEAEKGVDNLYHLFDLKKSSKQGQMRAKDCINESIPILFCLSSLLVWQMKIFFDWESLIIKCKNLGLGVTAGVWNSNQVQVWASILEAEVPILGAEVPWVGLGYFAFAGLAAIIGSTLITRNQFVNFMQNYETMQVQYRQQLVVLVEKLGFQVKEFHSIADLEKNVSDMCEWLLQQEEVEFDYQISEEELNLKLLECLTTNPQVGEAGANEQQANIIDDNNLVALIERKIKYLSDENIFQNCDQNIKLKPSRVLAALLIFIRSNYRIRLCTSKTWRIGIMGGSNAGKSTLSRFLGCAIPQTGQNHPTKDATLYQNVPVSNFCVIDFPHLDNVEAKDCMRMFYSLADIAIIVMKSQDGASEEGKNEEIKYIIKAMEMKYGNLGYSNRKIPILLLFNQVDQMVFDRPEDKNKNECEGDAIDENLKEKFEKQKEEIFKNLQPVGFDEQKLSHLFTAFIPTLPQPSKEERKQWMDEYKKGQITWDECDSKLESVNKNRLQKVTGCSFFKSDLEVKLNDDCIVNNLAKILEDLGNKDEATALKAVFEDHQDVNTCQ